MSKKKTKVKQEKFTIITILFLLGIVFSGLLMRFITYDYVVTDNMVQLKGADAYFFTRQASLINDKGYLPPLDANLCYPAGYLNQKESALYPYLLAFASRIVPLDLATAYLSPLIALAVSLIMVFVIRELFPGKVKPVLLATAVVSLTGIQYIARSYFGFGDRHILEVFLLVLGMWALIRAWNKQSLGFAVVAGLVFCLFQLSWSQTSLLLLMLILAIAVYYLKEQKVDNRFTQINILFLLLQLPAGIWAGYMQSIGISILGIGLFIFLHLINRRYIKVKTRVLLSMAAAIGSLFIIYFFFKGFYDQLEYVIGGFLIPKSEGPVVSEAQPMFTIYSGFSLFPFNTVTFQVFLFGLSIIGLFSMLNSKQYIWALFGLGLALLSLHRIRTEYYYLIFAGIALAYLAIKHPRTLYLSAALVVCFAISYSYTWSQDLQAQKSSLAFTNADYEMANWMKTNLPPVSEQDPEYGILADWQLGYLYTYIANKPMLSEPNFCNFDVPTRFFMMQDEQQAYELVKSLGIKYVLVKYMDYNKYYYYLNQLEAAKEFGLTKVKLAEGEKILYDQGYFQRMFVRLYNFNGLGYDPSLIYTMNEAQEVTSYQSFAEAVKSGAGKYYSPDLNASSVPLKALEYFRLIKISYDNYGGVKLFEVL